MCRSSRDHRVARKVVYAKVPAGVPVKRRQAGQVLGEQTPGCVEIVAESKTCVFGEHARRLRKRQRRQLMAAMRAKLEATMSELNQIRAELANVASTELYVLAGPINELTLLVKQLDDSIRIWRSTLYRIPRQR